MKKSPRQIVRAATTDEESPRHSAKGGRGKKVGVKEEKYTEIRMKKGRTRPEHVDDASG